VRILSLLPSATEIVFALGLGDSLVGVTAECDYPPEAAEKTVVSIPALPAGGDGARLSAAAVDAVVAEAVASGTALYRLDEAALAALGPDLVLAQDLCVVCAVPSGAVTEALDRFGAAATVVSLDPRHLDEVIAGVTAVAEAAGVGERGRAVAAGLEARLAAVGERVAGARRRRVVELEWSDPPYLGGHWVPEMVAAAGGMCVGASPGAPSAPVSWAAVGRAEAEVVVFAPCGYGLAEAVAEGEALLGRPELAAAAEVWAADGSAYFSRPGPRVVDGVELLAAMLHPECAGPTVEAGATRLR